MFEKKKGKILMIRIVLGTLALVMVSGLFLQLYSSYQGAKETEEQIEMYREMQQNSDTEEGGGYLDTSA